MNILFLIVDSVTKMASSVRIVRLPWPVGITFNHMSNRSDTSSISLPAIRLSAAKLNLFVRSWIFGDISSSRTNFNETYIQPKKSSKLRINCIYFIWNRSSNWYTVDYSIWLLRFWSLFAKKVNVLTTFI